MLCQGESLVENWVIGVCLVFSMKKLEGSCWGTSEMRIKILKGGWYFQSRVLMVESVAFHPGAFMGKPCGVGTRYLGLQVECPTAELFLQILCYKKSR